MHMMLCNVFYLYRAKRSKPDVQRDFGDVNAFVLCAVQQLRRKVKAGCRRSSGAQILAVDGLITLFILKLRCYVWGERHLTNLIENSINIFLAVKFDDAVAVLFYFADYAG